MKKKIILYIILITSIQVNAQSPILKEGNLNSWFLLMNRISFCKKLSFTNEFHERTGKFLDDQAQLLIRPSLDYHLNENVEFSIGYTFIRSWPYDPYSLPIPKNENNIWEQVLIKHSIGSVKFIHRFREENRWVEHLLNTNGEYSKDGIDFSNRFRYRIGMTFDLIKLKSGADKSIFLNCFDEFWFNQSRNLLPMDFSRNWLYLGIGFKQNKETNFQIGFMQQYDKVGIISYISSPIIQFSITKNFDLSSK